jgi:Uma2 family endonuclease
MVAARHFPMWAELPSLSVMEYLQRERRSMEKHEYINGLVLMMAGARESHVLITSNTNRTLGNQLDDRPCKVYMGDMKVRLIPTTYVYPDVTVICGEPQFEDDERDILLNPTVVIEVLSRSTENYDCGLKFRQYQQLVSLQEYILIAQDTTRIERFVQQTDGQWLLKTIEGTNDSIELTSIRCMLSTTDVYKKVSFENS